MSGGGERWGNFVNVENPQAQAVKKKRGWDSVTSGRSSGCLISQLHSEL